MTTFKIPPEKTALAEETFRIFRVGDGVELVCADAVKCVPAMNNSAFCFMDAEKETCHDLYELVVPCMTAGGLFVADNAVNHEATVRPMLDRAPGDRRVDAIVAPVGKGDLAWRKL
ncbi:MAG: hypothetical protein JSV91_06810 [Phycisphaerales bacterium]|nr:MAG: hypothetical protein JSV91_06810 [Phycisphaerales bacterium]